MERQPDTNTSPILRDYAADSSLLFVVFSGLRRSPGEVPGFSFRNVLANVPSKRLYLRDLTKAWYLRGLPGITRSVKETADFISAEVTSAGARHVVMTGYSLGGFAALLYASIVPVNEVIVFSPQTFVSLRQRIKHGDHRWQRYAWRLPFQTPARFRDLVPVLAKASQHPPVQLHYAEDSPLDCIHARHVADLTSIRLYPHAEGRHRLVTTLRDSGELLRIFENASLLSSASGGSRR